MRISATGAMASFAAAFAWSSGNADAAPAPNYETIAQGQRIAFERTKGNCPACHHMVGAETPGDLGPPLVAIRARFPDRQVLRRQLWDPMENNPRSRMPPFGRHRILTEDELDMVVEYLYSL
jgi:sulfur-oxidizing protein SoxX